MQTAPVVSNKRQTADRLAGGWRGWRASVRVRRRVMLAIIYLLLSVAGFVAMIPFAWMLSTSLKTPTQVFTWPIRWMPSPIVWQNYPEALVGRFWLWTRNTVLVAALSVAGIAFSSTLVGYSFARLRWRGRDALFLIMLATMMLPTQVMLIPRFVIFSKLRWVDTFLPLWAPTFLGSGFNIFLMRQFMLTLPLELDDAARLDGCGHFSILTRVILPQCLPPLGFVAINTFRSRWNSFLEPLIYLNKPNMFTLPLGLRNYVGQYSAQWGYLMAASVVAMLPILIVFFFGQRYFIQGVVFTGVKG